MTELRPLASGRLWSAAAPRGSTRATWPGSSLAPAARWCMSRAMTRGWRRCGRACGSSRPSCRCSRFRPGTACPTTAISPNPEIAAARMATLAALAGGFDRPAAVLTTVNAATKRVPAREVLAASELRRRGRRARRCRRSCAATWRGWATQQAPTVTEPGEFAIRGGLIDLWPPGARAPVRLDLFGDVLDSARRFDPETQRTTESVKRVELAPVSEVILDDGRDRALPHPLPRDVRRGRARRSALRGGQRRAQAAGLSSTGCRSSTSGWRRCSTICPARRCCSTTRAATARAARWAALTEQYDARAAALAAKSKLGTVYKPVPPGELYLDDAAWEAAVAGRPLHQLERAAAAARAGGDRRRRADRARLRARAAAGAGEPVRRAGRARGGAAQGRRRGDRELLGGRARAAGRAARRQRRRRTRARSGGRRTCAATAGSGWRSGRSSTASRRRG